MLKPLIFMFSGEGSQYFNMGRYDYTHIEIFKYHCDKLDKYLQDKFSFSVLDYIFSDSKNFSNRFDNISYTHPALFIIQYATAQTLLHCGYIPEALIGVSLGEILVAVLSEMMSWETGLELVVTQSRYVQQYCQTGAMLAIFGPKEIFIKFPEPFNQLTLAADNFANHFVVAGDEEYINAVKEKMLALNILTHVLPTQYAFHSNKMEPIKSIYLKYLSSIQLMEPKYNLFSCANATNLLQAIASHFWYVLRQPIFLRQVINQLEQENCFQYIDLGPSGTLSTFVKYNLSNKSDSRVLSTMVPGSKMTIIDNLNRFFR